VTPPLRTIIRIEAEVDITDAAIWYHGKESGLGHDFLLDVETAIARAAESPFRYPVCVAIRKFAACSQSGSPIACSLSAERTASSSSAFCTALATTASGREAFRKIERAAFARRCRWAGVSSRGTKKAKQWDPRMQANERGCGGFPMISEP
jgi:hypothetical protein